MSGEKVAIEKRVEALESKVQTIGEGLSEILTNLAKIDDAVDVQREAPADLEKIKWTEAEGEKGPFERSQDFNNPEHKKLIKRLAEHNGKMTFEGYFVWLYQNGSTIGRKKLGKRKAKTSKAAKKIASLFPENLRSLLTFKEEADAVIIKPRKYLGSEDFSKIGSIVRDAGGEYISAGKESHFRVPTN